MEQSFITLGMVINYKEPKAKIRERATGQSSDKLLREKVKVRAVCPRSLGGDQEDDPAVIKTQRRVMLQSLPLRNEVGGFVSQQHVLNRQSRGENEDLA